MSTAGVEDVVIKCANAVYKDFQYEDNPFVTKIQNKTFATVQTRNFVFFLCITTKDDRRIYKYEKF